MLSDDVDFRQLVNRVPGEASFIILSDSCHSGGLNEKEKEQIGPSSPAATDTTAKRHSHLHSDVRSHSKFISYESILQHLASVTNIEALDVGTDHLAAHFGEDASAKFRLSASELHQVGRLHPDAGILLSGCQANETSADMPGSDGGESYGAFSNAVETVFKEHSGPLTNRQVVTMARKLLKEQVGINYFNTQNELHGCIHDVRAIHTVLISRFGFDSSHIQVLTDEPNSAVKPTGSNIKAALSRMIDQAEAGDVLFFHFSGHGTRVPAPNNVGQDEAIVPVDFNLITGIDFRMLVNSVQREASFTILSDSCHSGGLIDKEKEQIGPHTTPERNNLLQPRAKFIPHESILQHLASVTNIDALDVGTHLVTRFGADASAKFRLSARKLQRVGRLRPDAGILLSGCQANETSADLPGTYGGGAYGAFSNAVETVFKRHPRPVTNRQVVTMARRLPKEQGVGQNPCLYCSDENADAHFLRQP
ncbi:hypothetical protein Ancab_013972 [Ancistrocladus abbreviatus]